MKIVEQLLDCPPIQSIIHAIKDIPFNDLSSQEAIQQATPLIKTLCQEASWLPKKLLTPISDETVHILYVGPSEGIMLLIDCWPSGIRGNVHNHNTWAVVGCLAGKEQNNLWSRLDDGNTPHFCQLQQTGTLTLHPGEATAMDVEAIHSVDNIAAEHSLSISAHLYGKDLRTTHRKLFFPHINKVTFNPNTEFHHTDT